MGGWEKLLIQSYFSVSVQRRFGRFKRAKAGYVHCGDGGLVLKSKNGASTPVSAPARDFSEIGISHE